ncbi:helix-turn-helix domain-containing protein [Nocardia sp. NPDC127579]|uniref:helix-turn-helix domain-containing protein n=1 Tax=Nocardia sp. NPDC127579 TaxID=3345402 RepID=UPI00363404C8
MEANMARLGQAVKSRRLELGLTQQEVAQAGGPSDTTQTGIEKGVAKSVSPSTLRKLDAALGWAVGSSKEILDGGEPTTLRHAPIEQDQRVTLSDTGHELLISRLWDQAANIRDGMEQDPERTAVLAGELAQGIHASWATATKALELGAPPADVERFAQAGFTLLIRSGLLFYIEPEIDLMQTILDEYREVQARIEKAGATTPGPATPSAAAPERQEPKRSDSTARMQSRAAPPGATRPRRAEQSGNIARPRRRVINKATPMPRWNPQNELAAYEPDED